MSNPIQLPYTYLEYSTGTSLEHAYGDMSLPEKLSVVDAVVKFLSRAESITFPRPGRLRAARGHSPVTKGVYSPNGSIDKIDMEIRDFEVGNRIAGNQSPPSLSEFHEHQLEAWYGKDWSEPGINRVSKMWVRVCSMFKELKERGFFKWPGNTSESDEVSILYHWDFEPRNILLKLRTDSSNDEANVSGEEGWEIDKVIDWDGVYAVPSILTRKPPVWLWDDLHTGEHASLASDFDFDYDMLDLARYDSISERFSAESQQIKQQFEHSFVAAMSEIYPEYDHACYVDEAYGRGRWIRRIARYAIHGASDSQDLKRFEQIEQEWASYSNAH
jgi:hypothetical protein